MLICDLGNTGSVPGVFPSLCLQDGPLGLRFADHATAWPAGLTVGATWNKELMLVVIILEELNTEIILMSLK